VVDDLLREPTERLAANACCAFDPVPEVALGQARVDELEEVAQFLLQQVRLVEVLAFGADDLE
jgi:hypothetical protein